MHSNEKAFSIFLSEGTNDPLRKLTTKALSSFDIIPGNYDFEIPLWDMDYFNLDQCPLFLGLPKNIQTSILLDLNQSLLAEAYYIEQAGMSFAAKMSQNSRTIDERVFYSIMGAEEAIHFKILCPYIDIKNLSLNQQYFARFIGNLITEGSFEALNVLIQVVLEGWGLVHYFGLQNYCQNPQLKLALKRIIVDEARHHGCGVKLTQHNHLDSESEKFIHLALHELLQMVQVGPQNLVQTLIPHLKFSDQSKHLELLESIEAPIKTQEKLTKLQHIIKPVISEKLYKDLLQKELFSALPVSKMV